VTDTTGCGDTFLAAYLAGVIAGKQPAEAGHFAAAAAALKQTVFGPLMANHGEYAGSPADGSKSLAPERPHLPAFFESFLPQ